jgi:hypothetical protein
MESECADREGIDDAENGQAKRAISNKVIAVVIVAVLLGSSGFYIWHEYYRHWSISDLERAAVVVEWDFKSSTFPNALGFRQNLAGRTVIVEGTVSSTREMSTTLGNLTIVYLEGGVFCGLMLWDEPAPEDGARVEIPVKFEWGTMNGEEGVYSRQTTLPGFGVFALTQPMIQSVCWAMGELVITLTDTGDEVTLNLEGCPEPIPLEMMNCSLMSGTHVGTQDYIDLMDQYHANPIIDVIPDLSERVGSNGTIAFEDDDGYLDGGDSFVLRNLSRPDTDGGALTYFLRVARDLYPFENEQGYRENVLQAYIIMTNEGALWVTNPVSGIGGALAVAHQSALPEGRAFTVDHVWGNLSWNDSVFQFMEGAHVATWDAPLGALDSGSMETYSLGVEDLGSLRVELILSDLTGNGQIDTGDRMEVVARDGADLVAGEMYSFRIVNQMTHAPALGEEFLYCADPASECTLSTSDDSVSIVLGPVHNGTGRDYEDVDVVWGEVLVRLESEGNVTEWHLATEGLWGEGQISWESDVAALGETSVVCSVLDLQGNSAVDAGDRVEIAVLPPVDGFDPDAEYTVSFVYLPTGSTIFSAAFAGAP